MGGKFDDIEKDASHQQQITQDSGEQLAAPLISTTQEAPALASLQPDFSAAPAKPAPHPWEQQQETVQLAPEVYGASRPEVVVAYPWDQNQLNPSGPDPYGFNAGGYNLGL